MRTKIYEKNQSDLQKAANESLTLICGASIINFYTLAQAELNIIIFTIFINRKYLILLKLYMNSLTQTYGEFQLILRDKRTLFFIIIFSIIFQFFFFAKNFHVFDIFLQFIFLTKNFADIH